MLLRICTHIHIISKMSLGIYTLFSFIYVLSNVAADHFLAELIWGNSSFLKSIFYLSHLVPIFLTQFFTQLLLRQLLDIYKSRSAGTTHILIIQCIYVICFKPTFDLSFQYMKLPCFIVIYLFSLTLTYACLIVTCYVVMICR